MIFDNGLLISIIPFLDKKTCDEYTLANKEIHNYCVIFSRCHTNQFKFNKCCRFGQLESAKILLNKCDGIDVTHNDSGFTDHHNLINSCYYDHVHTVKWLLELYKKNNITFDTQKMFQDELNEINDIVVVKALIKLETQYNYGKIDIHIIFPCEETLFIQICEYGNVEVVKYILSLEKSHGEIKIPLYDIERHISYSDNINFTKWVMTVLEKRQIKVDIQKLFRCSWWLANHETIKWLWSEFPSKCKIEYTEKSYDDYDYNNFSNYGAGDINMYHMIKYAHDSYDSDDLLEWFRTIPKLVKKFNIKYYIDEFCSNGDQQHHHEKREWLGELNDAKHKYLSNEISKLGE
jgi:hypothetical protein